MAVVISDSARSEYEMFSNYRLTRDTGLRDEIVENYIYIAEILSRRFSNRGVEYDDIYQMACMGILYAVERFDPDRGVKFATFATPTVLGEIRRYLRDKGSFIKVPRRLYEIFYKAEKIKRSHARTTDEEIARILEIPKEYVDEAYSAGDTAFIRSLEHEAFADGEINLIDTLGVEDNRFLMIENRDVIRYLMDNMNDEERQFIELRYIKELSQRKIADILEVSQMHVCRFEKKLLKKMRDLYFEK